MTIVLMAIAIMSANAQNIQLHYDFGRHLYPDQEENRQSATITLEQFKADKWGSQGRQMGFVVLFRGCRPLQ